MLVLTHFKGHTVGGFLAVQLKTFPSAAPQGNWASSRSISCRATGPGREAAVHGTDGGRRQSHYQSFWATYYLYQRAPEHVRGLRLRRARRRRHPPRPDLGIIASTDILAVDQASVDMVYALPEAQRRDLVERIESRSGCAQLEYMKLQGMGNNQYDLITV